jgi:3-oxoacyl-[acyl-carrier protein] reductase
MDMDFTAKVAVVTGASRGIGACVARELGKRGARVVLAARTPADMEKVKHHIDGSAGQALAVPTDVTCRADVENMVRTALGKWGRIDILINNAGMGTPFQRVEEITDQEWRDTISLNLDSAFMVSRAVVPHMKARQYGRVLMVSSLDGVSYSDTDAARYTAAKAGLGGLMRQMAFELGPFNITCNAVAPGFTMSERVRAKWMEKSEALRQGIVGRTPMGRVAEMEDVALPIVFLVSDWARYITGTTLIISGGYYM